MDTDCVDVDRAKRRLNAQEALRLGQYPKRHREARNGLAWTDGQRAVMRTCYERMRRCTLSAIIGGRGRGKTQMATEVSYWLSYEHETRLRYWTFGDMIANFREWSYTQGKPESGWFGQNCSARCLVIDELGERRDTEDEGLFLTRVLDYRYRNVLGTIVIANTKPSELATCLGDSGASRLCEGGAVLECNWPSFRGAQ